MSGAEPARVGRALHALEQTRLRLVRSEDESPLRGVLPNGPVRVAVKPADPHSSLTNDSFGAPIKDPADPRWVMAVRTAAEMEGTLLRPESRDELLKLGKRLGLSSFDANLIIAIIQDQARRGYSPEYCPTAGEPQLRMVPRRAHDEAARRGKALRTAIMVAAVLAVEIVFVAWLIV
ncbi:MAG: hypothetical protein K8S99_00915 [Planctomycetes bacterium]|nr:hypothetical protein [Planctomycetota bacterium]